jgi:hypothetical protein
MILGGIEPPTRGFSVRRAITNHVDDQSLAALAKPHPRLSKAHIRHLHDLAALELHAATAHRG